MKLWVLPQRLDTGASPSFNYVFVDNVWHAYGGFQGESETVAIDADTWTHITNGDNDLWVGLETNGFTLTDDELIVTNTGDYTGTLSITFEGLNQQDFLFRIYNVTQTAQAGYQIGATGLGANNYVNVSIPIYLEATAGDHYQFQVYQVNGNDATFYNAIFHISYLHD